jgi:hypothetical protein
VKAYCFFSVHEEIFHRIAVGLRDYGVTSFSGFVWGHNHGIAGRGIDYDPLVVFTRDLLPKCDDGTRPDVAWLARREAELGVSIQRMIASERHLLAGRDFDRIARMVEVALREVAAAYDRARPDFVFTEDVSCLHSYVHYVLARERGIPFWSVTGGRIANRVAVYSSGMQHLERVERLYPQLVARGLAAGERADAEAYVAKFRDRPARPPGMDQRAKRPGIELGEATRFRAAALRYLRDRDDPTATSPLRAVRQRLRRMARVRRADSRGVFSRPVVGEKYVLYPIHYQPEATTLVQAPMFLDQLALIQDIAKCLPIDHRLYVKEHLTNRGRRPIEFYEAIRAIPSARLLGPDEDTWQLVRNASAIAVITGTMGWEGLLFGKPVITFGDVFFNILPHVYRAGLEPKDRWYELFKRAATAHVDNADAVLALVAALQACSYPGFFGNATSFPPVLADDNIAMLTAALATEVGLRRSTAAAG